MRTACWFVAFAAIAQGAATVGGAPQAAEKKPGTKQVADFTLKDYHGQPFHLAEAARGKTVVLAFLGTECPLAKLYAPRLAELAAQYGPQGVIFVGIDANRQDAVTEIAAYARTHHIEFPILKDLNQVVADQVGATRTPEVIVLDAERRVRYQGRIDDQYGLVHNAGYQRKEPSRRDLAVALDELLSGKAVSQPQTESTGCLIGRDRAPKADAQVTYSNQIARILNENCVSCHRTGQIAPFTLTDYDDVAGWAGMIDEVVQGGRMPPWHADPRYGQFSNDARMSDADKKLISRWVADGAPQGNPKQLPPPPKFAEGWMIPEPDQVVTMPQAFKVPATGVVDYQMFTVDPGWTEDKWISALEPRPGNPAVVHHILLFVLPPDGRGIGGLGAGNDFTGAFAPGLRPEPLPTGMARHVPAGSKLIFQMHYTPNGSPQEDRSYVGFKFADPKTVKQEVLVTSAVNFAFEIPPGANDFVAKSRYVFKKDALLLTLMPHMHLRGKAFRYDVTYPDGKQEVLLSVPQYDFGWQTNYRLSEPKLMPMGTRLDCTAHFDNSDDNLNNPDPKAAVRFGDQTFEEMLIGFFEMTDPHQDLTKPQTDRPERQATRAEESLVVLRATNGEPDDNLKLGTFMALTDAEWFGRFAFILPMTLPQVDRVCLTVIDGDKLTQKFGPFTGRMPGGKAPPESIRSPLPDVAADGEPLAQYAAGEQPVMHADLSQVDGAEFKRLVSLGAKSSLHVPVRLGDVQGTINFWSTDADAFPAPVVQVLTGLAKAAAAPKPAQGAGGK